jgi:SAM-dependent methyltransferase
VSQENVEETVGHAGRDPYARLLGRFYAFYIERPFIARIVGALSWGTTFRPLYRSLAGLRDIPPDQTVLDACCGGGLVLRWINPAVVRYVGIDTSVAMLERAREGARRHGLANAEFQLADVAAIPLPDRTADLALLYNALHVVSDPEAAIREVGRCLKPDGRVLGSMIVRGRGRRADGFMAREAQRSDGIIGPGGSESELVSWLTGAGFGDLNLLADGPLIAFSAVGRSAQD